MPAFAALFLAAPLAMAGPATKHSHHPHTHAHTTPPARQHLTKAKLDAATPSAAAPKPDPIGRSVGSPTEGHLIGGAHLGESPFVRIVPVYQPGDARWGVEPLVSAIDRAARTVRKQFPDAVASVGHLSRHGGGEIDRHASHESGRDADVGFYVRNEKNKGIYADHFVAFKPDGTAASWPGAHFDDAKNWAFVSSIATDVHARVTHIFVATPIRARLMQYAEKIGAPLAVRTRASELMAQPKGSLPHDDHFHIRVACPSGSDSGSNKCIEQPAARKHGAAPHGLVANNKTKPTAPAVAHAPGHGLLTPPPARPVPPKPKDKDDDRESFVPNLAPMVPGLDSAVIPAPLFGTKPAPETSNGAPEGPPPIIDDPDGVLSSP